MMHSQCMGNEETQMVQGDLRCPLLLSFVEDYDGILEQRTSKNQSIKYTKLKQSYICRSCPEDLQRKLMQINNEKSMNTVHEEKIQIEQDEIIEQLSKYQEPQEKPKYLINLHTGRYFNESGVYCFKCQKRGHYQNLCMKPNRCFFCLSEDHSSTKCPLKKLCSKCGIFQHGVSFQKGSCLIKNGEDEEGAYLTDNFTRDKKQRRRYCKINLPQNYEQIICLGCFGNGHLYDECFN